MEWQDCEVLDLDDRPKKLLITHFAVPPVAIHPSVVTDGGSNEDDITMKLQHIMSSNLALHAHLESGSSLVNCMETWDLLQVQVAMYMNSELPGLPPGMQPPGK